MRLLEPRTGTAFVLRKGERLKVTDPRGEQVSDFFAFALDRPSEYLSSGRTFDYLSKIYITAGDILYSSASRPLVRMVEDTVGRHDFLLTPCSKDTFRIIYNDASPHHGCEGNLLSAFRNFGVTLPSLPSTLNLFMYVDLNEKGELKVLPPKSRAGDYVILEALEDLLVGLTACSALQSNNGSFKPIAYESLGIGTTVSV
jgi:uncharacterized protein YcgI (DUF1989 family)